jgi:SAM-dependent methyltransferase
MLIEEARWLQEKLRDLAPGEGTTLLDIGSSTEYFRRMDQPYIDYYIFRPLRQAGVKIVHVDSRSGEGVDLVADISDRASEATIAQIPPGDIVLCSNMLEHVLDRDLVARRLERLTKPGGSLIVTVPHVYHYHEDPIDTMFRPTNHELEALFSRELFSVTASEILDVSCGYVDEPVSFVPYVLARARRLVKLHLLRQTLEFDRCKVAAVILRKKDAAQG